MAIDKSLKVKMGAMRSRNVLKRGERLEKLKETERWTEGQSVMGLPKVRVVKISLKKKKKAKTEEGAAGDKGKPAAGGKGAAAKPAAKPAAGAKK